MFQQKTLEDISQMDGRDVAKALEYRLIQINDMDKAVLVLDKLQELGSTKPNIKAECAHLENFIKKYKF